MSVLPPAPPIVVALACVDGDALGAFCAAAVSAEQASGLHLPPALHRGWRSFRRARRSPPVLALALLGGDFDTSTGPAVEKLSALVAGLRALVEAAWTPSMRAALLDFD